ncbi:hypothetical protein ACJRO7_024197 [Eucalyptus globulus]|uniref:Uncharacterized protein n=1 Tax=Eucalyptus globulus TaxID=34317 RepID=A0ABD3K7T7_EUCGL
MRVIGSWGDSISTVRSMRYLHIQVSRVSLSTILVSKCEKGAKVSLTCMDQRHKVIFYRSSDTYGAGQFNIIINNYINEKQPSEKLCLVRLVSSLDLCNVATNFAGGCRAVKLSCPSSVHREVIKYAVGPLYLDPLNGWVGSGHKWSDPNRPI